MKKNSKSYIVIGAVIAVCIAAVLWSLFSFNVIRVSKPYKAKYLDLSENDLGSARRLEGRTAFVSIFVNDDETSWDLGSDSFSARRDEILGEVRIALDWVSAQAAKYGKTAGFVSAESPDEKLLYSEGTITGTDLAGSVFDMYLHDDGGAAWDYIDANIDTAAINDKYSCDNIVYAFFICGEDMSGEAFPVFNTKHDKPYELYVCSVGTGEERLCPSTIAHEMIHLFGAPDLYASDLWRTGYEFTDEAVEYCKENFPTDIMLSTKDPETGTRLPDRINNDITPMTAYYLGWCDAPIDIDEYELVHSQFDKGE